jgi:YfiH family protein
MTPKLHYYHIAEGVTAFSTTRHGGYSQGNYGELNVNLFCGDEPEAIAKNRRLLCKELAVAEDHLVMPHQVHDTGVSQIGNTFFLLSEEIRKQVLEGIDALITNIKHICIGVSTADCIPIIIYDPEHHAAGVVHSGWRGTMANITGRVVTSMQMAYQSKPELLKAVIGPGISLKNFEVGDEVYEAFADAGYPMEQISQKQEKWHIDLFACCRLQLEATGIKTENIVESGICTYDNVEDFFSARKLGIASGRILTGIVLK